MWRSSEERCMANSQCVEVETAFTSASTGAVVGIRDSTSVDVELWFSVREWQSFAEQVRSGVL